MNSWMNDWMKEAKSMQVYSWLKGVPEPVSDLPSLSDLS